ncbi:hypothetical protein THAOC_27809, partial [Thalassiosira oceanica]
MGPDPRGGSRVVDVGTYDELISRGHDLRTISHDGSAGEDQDGPEVGVTSGSDSGGPVAARGENSTPERVPSHADPDCRVALDGRPRAPRRARDARIPRRAGGGGAAGVGEARTSESAVGGRHNGDGGGAPGDVPAVLQVGEESRADTRRPGVVLRVQRRP